MRTIVFQSIFLATGLIACFVLNANAQKLPTIQQTGIRAPANVKVDGKPTEWGNKFEAYNTAADVWYTMANDNDNLYLVIQASNLNIINTIAGYGFELAIHKSGRKSEADKISISYPVPGKNSNPFTFGGGNMQVDLDTSINHLNEVMAKNNKTIAEKFKWIVVKGMPGIDTVAIYNTENILAASRIDAKKVYTLELAVPLKKLGIVNGTSNFSYHITINGYTSPQNMKVMDQNFREVTVVTPDMQQAIDDLNMRIAKRNPHVDFWGDYTLAK